MSLGRDPRLGGWWLAVFTLAGCSARSLQERADRHNLEQPLPSSVAPAGKVRLFVGQDVHSIESYAAEVGAPAGLVGYTSLIGLEGLSSPHDGGGGPMHLRRLSEQFPDAPVAVGLYLVGALGQVVSGALDDQLDALAEELTGYGVPVLLRVGYEFDGEWNRYQPDEYRAAFAHVSERLAVAGAERVELVWQAAASCGGTFGGHPVDAWYPGDEHVDWVAASVFAQGACEFAPLKRLLHLARERRKPFFIAEATPQGYDLSDQTYSQNGLERRAAPASAIAEQWFEPYFALITDSLDVVRAATYINADWDAQPMWGPPYANGYFGDSRVQANPELLSRWHAALEADHWLR